MKKLLLSTVCTLLVLVSLAQRSITGRVIDEKGNAVQSASVQVKGAAVGTTTRNDGSFSLQVPAGSNVIVVSFLGYEDREITVGTSTQFDIALKPRSNVELGEVVVTALGITRDKRSLGYATQNIKAEELQDRGDINVANVLQGKVSGVDITGASGSAGASTNINIRGITSFTGSNQPLFVVDGIPINNEVDLSFSPLRDQQPANRALDLNLNNIESVNILKGPAAAVLYGSRASAGAIIITTKKGNAGQNRARVNFTSSYSIQDVTGLPEYQNQYGAGTGGLYNPIGTTSWGPAFNAEPTRLNGLMNAAGVIADYRAYPDNIKNFYETGTTFDNNLTISGGDNKQNFSISLGNTNQKGILPNTEFQRTNIVGSFNAQLNERISLGASMQYIDGSQVGITQGNGAGSALFQLFSVPRSFDLQFYKDNYKNPDGTVNWPLSTTRDNPYFAAYENPVTSKNSRTMGNIRLGYAPAKWLNISYRLGVDQYTDRRKIIIALNSAAASGLGRVVEDNFYKREVNGDLIITAKKDDFFLKNLNATLLVGNNINDRVYQNNYLQADELNIPGFYNVSNGNKFDQSGETFRLRRLVGYYAQASFAYNNYLFLELTSRMDQSSTLPQDKNSYFYPSISTGFVFTDALGLKSDFLSYGKVRASYAKVGRDADVYQLENLFVTGGYGNNVAQFSFPYGTIPGWAQSTRIGSNTLSPEFTSSYEVGFNLGLLKNRVSIDAAYFNAVSESQIFAVGIPTTTGFNTKVSNTGRMVNKGIEFLVNGSVISSKDLRWDVTANFTRIRNKVESIGDGILSFPIASGFSFGGAVASIVEGQPYGVVVGNDYQRSPDGQYLINPATGTFFGSIANQIIADPNRNFIAGLTNTVKYKTLTFSFLLDYKDGGEIVSWGVIANRLTGALKETGVDRDQPRILPGVIKTPDDKYVPNNIQIPAQVYWVAMGQTSGAGSLGVFDATVLRLREISMSIEMPRNFTSASKIFSDIRLTLFGRNLWYYAPNSPFDTEVNTYGASNLRGFELQSTPNVRSMGASLRMTLK
jgi:TonB-linked SusC/RagA family outer membrane protein